MGQKVHPYGFRVGYNKDWHSHWYAKKEFSEYLAEDLKLKRDLKKRFVGAGVSHIDVERAAKRIAKLEQKLAQRQAPRSAAVVPTKPDPTTDS